MYNAGFRIIALERTHKGNGYTEGIALGEKDGAFGLEYVTWGYTERDDEYDFYWGHYFTDEETAYEDYHERVRR